MSMITELIESLNKNPEEALMLSDTLRKILGPWEELSADSNSAATGTFLVIKNMMGTEVAQIIKDYPKYKISIEGEFLKDAPFITHGKDIMAGRVFVEKKLRERGYIVRDSKVEEK